MEEKKNKVVKMEGKNAKNEKQQKLTYEQLNQACQELFQQNQRLVQQLREANMVNFFKRLDYLFKVVEFASTFKDGEFVNTCIDEIKDSMIVREEPEEEKKESK